jgi:hypothetical protein
MVSCTTVVFAKVTIGKTNSLRVLNKFSLVIQTPVSLLEQMVTRSEERRRNFETRM